MDIDNNKKSDIETFINYFNHKNFWLDVFKPNINGERPKGLLTTGFFKKKDKKALIKRINDYNGKGIVCLAVNNREDRDKTIKSIDEVHSLVIDVDVKKSFKQGFVSLPEHHDKAIETANNIKAYLHDKGFKVSMVVDSGNGAQIYVHINASFSKQYFEERKRLIKEVKEEKHLLKEIQTLIKEEELFRRIESFEKDLKNQFNQDFIEIDNITKDLNRRMKIAGTINKKDEHQIEDRVSKILYFNEEYNHDDIDNQNALEEYEVAPIKIVVSKEKKVEKLVNEDDIKLNYRLEAFLKSRKPKDVEFKKTFNAENLDALFSGDRSAAEQSIVNSLYFRGFRSLNSVSYCMQKCKIGKWQEANQGYRETTFDKAEKFYLQKKEERQNKKESFEENFIRYTIYLLEKEAKTKYIVHDNQNQKYVIKHGNDSLADYLYLKLQQDKVDLNELNNYYPDSNQKPKNLLLDFIQDKGFVKTISNYGFKPVAEIEFEEDGNKLYNTYRETQYLALSSNDEDINLSEDCPCINDLLLNVAGKDKEGREYLLKLLAFMLQNPHIKTEKLVVLYGEEGSGKGITFNHIIKPLLVEYAIALSQDILDSPYNGSLSQKICVYFNEVENKKENENILKSWITEPTIQINEKYGGMRNERSYFTIFADVNGNNPITAGNRRTVYFKSRTLGGSFKKSQELGEKYVAAIPKELPKFAQYLKNLEVTHSEIRAGYDTQAKKDVLDNVKTLEQQFIDMLDQYESFRSWCSAINTISPIDYNNYLLNEWLDINFLLDSYNAFRRMKGYLKPVVSNRFAWIYDALNLDRSNQEQVKRKTNPSGRKVNCIKFNEFISRFKPLEKDDIKLENLTIKSEDLNKITEEVV